MSDPLRVAYTLEQCWHRVPGGTGVAALETLDAVLRDPDAPQIVGVAGTHVARPTPPWAPGVPVESLPGHGARLYATWLWLARPTVEMATGPVDVAHATSIIPCPSRAPLVVTVHDLAFLHEPAHFTRWGRAVFHRSLAVVRRRAALVLCSSEATADDCEGVGIERERLRVVPLGVRSSASPTDDERTAVRVKYRLPERYVLFVGTHEPRKNLAALIEAMGRTGLDLPLVAVGPEGWGERPAARSDVRILGFVPSEDLAGLYASATVFAYPSLREGFGLPVLEAMAHGVPVVTSRGTATAEAAGTAAVLVDPRSVDDIARGIVDAMADAPVWAARGRQRAAEMTWEATARATCLAYREAANR